MVSEWKKDPDGNEYRIHYDTLTVEYKPKYVVEPGLPVIPLENYNCLHCNFYKKGCGIMPINLVTGKPCSPKEHVCFRIGRNYKG